MWVADKSIDRERTDESFHNKNDPKSSAQLMRARRRGLSAFYVVHFEYSSFLESSASSDSVNRARRFINVRQWSCSSVDVCCLGGKGRKSSVELHVSLKVSPRSVLEVYLAVWAPVGPASLRRIHAQGLTLDTDLCAKDSSFSRVSM